MLIFHMKSIFQYTYARKNLSYLEYSILGISRSCFDEYLKWFLSSKHVKKPFFAGSKAGLPYFTVKVTTYSLVNFVHGFDFVSRDLIDLQLYIKAVLSIIGKSVPLSSILLPKLLLNLHSTECLSLHKD